MDEEKTAPGTGQATGGPDRKIVYAVIAIAVVILAVVPVAKFGYNTDVLNPAGGQMSLVQQRPGLTGPTPTVVVEMKKPRLCPIGTSGCGGTCLNLSFNNGNCGSCGNACNVSQAGFCSQGTCCYPRGDPTCEGVVCTSGYSCCRGRCVPGGP